jgi:hypothetical protein
VAPFDPDGMLVDAGFEPAGTLAAGFDPAGTLAGTEFDPAETPAAPPGPVA